MPRRHSHNLSVGPVFVVLVPVPRTSHSRSALTHVIEAVPALVRRQDTSKAWVLAGPVIYTSHPRSALTYRPAICRRETFAATFRRL